AIYWLYSTVRRINQVYNVLGFYLALIATIFTILSVFITILLNKKEIQTALKEKKINNFKDLKSTFSRRKFLIGSTTIVGITIWNLFNIPFINRKIKTFIFLFLPNSNQLVINKNTGVVHHEIFCKNHLPKEKNRKLDKKISPNVKFHESKKIQILNKISQNISIEDSIQVLLLAVENNPTSVHLYDKLIKLFGTIKRYESIHLLLNTAERDISNKINMLSSKTKEYKRYNKALKHIQTQKNIALIKARYKAINS
ncbi:MAG: hypothetical protein K8R44_09170, partial [Sulfurimonas sp.]|nr:hypothetical protein [Sulfurimonas sp.]